MTGAMTPFSGNSGVSPKGYDTGWQPWTTGVPAGYSIQMRFIDGIVWISVDSTANIPTGATVIATGFPPAPPGAWAACNLGGHPGLIAVSGTGDVRVRNETGAARAYCSALYSYPLE